MGQDWWEHVEMDDLEGGARGIAEVIGVPATIKLMRCYGGTNLYVPKPDDVIRRMRDARIRKEYNGYNAKSLAYRYGLAERTIQVIASNNGEQIKGQLDMFGEPG